MSNQEIDTLAIPNSFPKAYISTAHKNDDGHGFRIVYNFPNGWGLSLINAPSCHVHPYAWDAAILVNNQPDYTTPFTDCTDLPLFYNDEEAAAFIKKVTEYFTKESKDDDESSDKKKMIKEKMSDKIVFSEENHIRIDPYGPETIFICEKHGENPPAFSVSYTEGYCLRCILEKLGIEELPYRLINKRKDDE